MKKIKSLLTTGLLLVVLGLAAGNKSLPAQKVSAADVETTLSVKSYTPDKYDFHDYWGGVGDIDEGGITTFAHASGLIPLKGDAIHMETSAFLLSKQAKDVGGDEVDGWLTYSFSSTVGGGSDNSFPYNGGAVSGYFVHITNYSATATPNTVEIQFVKSVDGATETVISGFVDNLITNTGTLANDEIVFSLDLKKVGDSYTIKFTNLATEAVLIEVPGLPLDESLFINEKGQTFFSTAIYEGPGCDGNHWEHRGIRLYSFDAYTYDAAGVEVELDHDSFAYDGLAHLPEVSVKLNEKELVADVDYYIEGKGLTEVGEGKVVVNFIGDYAGNTAIEKAFNVLAIDASTAVVTLEKLEFVETGSAIEPSVSEVKLGESVLVADTDYEVSYANNTAVGEAKVVVTFVGNYSGSVEVKFTITAAAIEEPSETPSEDTSTPPSDNPSGGCSGCSGNVTATIISSVVLLGLASFFIVKKRFAR